MPMNIADVKPVAVPLHGDVWDKARGIRIAILAEGFVTAADSQEFRRVAAEAKDYLIERRPFRDYLDRFAITAIDCKSKVSARLLKREERRPYDNVTPFDATFDYPGRSPTHTVIARGMSCDADAVRRVCAAAYPGVKFDAHLVIVNSTQDGGEAVMSEAIACLTLEDPAETFLHELGHALGGLIDEYGNEDADSPSHYAGGADIPFANVTRDIGPLMKWWDFLSAIEVPSTEPDGPGVCKRDHAAKKSEYEAFGVVGAFEGAWHHSCGLYRPSFACRMRDGGPFCPVCANAIRRVLVGSRFLATWSYWPLRTKPPKSQETLKSDGWTHVLDFTGLYGRAGQKDGSLLMYDARSGQIALLSTAVLRLSMTRRVPGSPPPPTLRVAITDMMQTLDAGWMTVTAFAVGGEPFIVGTRFDTGVRTFVKVSPDKSYNGAAFQVLNSVADPDGPWTHVVAFELGAVTYLLSYNYLNGRVALDEMIDNMGLPEPHRLASYDWTIGWDQLVVLDRAGQTLIAAFNTRGGIAQVLDPHRPDPAGSVLTSLWTSPLGFLPPFITHCSGIAFQGQALIVTHAVPGVVAVHSVRASGKPILDFNERRAIGFGPYMLLGTGAPAMGAVEDNLWFYGTTAGEFRFLDLA